MNDEIRRSIEAAFQALADRDSRPLVAALADGVTWRVIGDTSWSGPWFGREAVVRDLLRPLGARIAGRMRIATQPVLAEGDRIVVEGRGDNATVEGRRYDNAYCWVCRVDAGGRIAEIVEYCDTALVERALGARDGEPRGRFSADAWTHALRFATRAHAGQVTPHGEPYVVHVTLVAGEVASALPHHPELRGDLAIRCALLHDVVEDTQVTLADLRAAFGDLVADGVDALTKRPVPDSMGDSLDRILAAPREVAIVKLADRITNLSGHPPAKWDARKRAAYRAQGQVILDRLGFASDVLASRLADRIAAYPATG